jgi:hypothetical protein
MDDPHVGFPVLAKVPVPVEMYAGPPSSIPL